MDKNEFESALREREVDERKFDLKYRDEIQMPSEQQEVVRRGIEALLVAAKTVNILEGEEVKTLNTEITKKLSEFIGKLKPLN